MQEFKVNIDFKRQESFGTQLKAKSEHDALAQALVLARRSGWDAEVKKHKVSPVQ